MLVGGVTLGHEWGEKIEAAVPHIPLSVPPRACPCSIVPSKGQLSTENALRIIEHGKCLLDGSRSFLLSFEGATETATEMTFWVTSSSCP